MAKEIQLPFLAEGIEGGDVVSLLVKAGDDITEGQSILELETDKATVPVPAPFGGKVGKLLIKQGDHVTVGQGLVEMADGGAGAAPQPSAPTEAKVGKAAAPAEPAKEPTKEPTKEPAKEPAQAAAAPAEEGALEPAAKAPPKAAAEAPPKAAAPAEEKAAAKPAGAPVYAAQHDGEARKRPKQPSPEPAAAPAETEAAEEPAAEAETGAPVPASPSVRRLARELGVDLRQVKGTENGGRINQEDVKAYVRTQAGKPAAAPAGKTAPAPAANGNVFTTLYGTERREALPSIRRKIAATMANAWSTIPHVHQFHDADITELIDLQKRYAAKFKEKGASLTLTSLILKAVTHALKVYPHFNASLDLTNGEIIVKDYYNLGVAVDTEYGLIVPVIHNVDKKPLLEIALELADVAQRTRDKQVKLEELRGATFTISNLGGMGGGAFTPIINPPEVAILGVGRGKVMPVYRDGKLQPRNMLPLCVAYDHRLIDGADGARFAAEVGKILEDYEAMFLGL